MVRGNSPPARDPSSSWFSRRSTMTTSAPASVSSAASISPVGPPPAITTPWSVTSHPQHVSAACGKTPRARYVATGGAVSLIYGGRIDLIDPPATALGEEAQRLVDQCPPVVAAHCERSYQFA